MNTHKSDATIITLLHSIIQARYRYTSTLLNGKLFASPGRPGIYLPRKVKVELDLSYERYEWSGVWLYTRITVSMYLCRWMQTSYNSQANYSLACVSSETHNLQRVFHPRGVLPYIGYIGMCGAKGYVFVAVLVWNRVLISTIVVWNRVWFVPSSVQLGMFLEEAASSSFGDKTISLLMFTPTVACRNSLSRTPVTRRAPRLQVWNRVSNLWSGLK